MRRRISASRIEIPYLALPDSIINCDREKFSYKFVVFYQAFASFVQIRNFLSSIRFVRSKSVRLKESRNFLADAGNVSEESNLSFQKVKLVSQFF